MASGRGLMRRADRLKSNRLEAAMRRLETENRRTLMELEDAGYRFATVQEASARWELQRRFPGFEQWQLDALEQGKLPTQPV